MSDNTGQPINGDPEDLLELSSAEHDGPAALVRETERLVRLAVTDRPLLEWSGELPLHIGATAMRPGDDVVIRDLEQYLPEPKRARGDYVTYDSESFIAVVKRLAGLRTTLWAEQPSTGASKPQITAVLNDDGGYVAGETDPGWRDHRVRLDVRVDPDWAAWARVDTAGDPELQRGMSQVGLAEFLNDHMHNIAEGGGSQLLKAVTTFSTDRKLRVSQNINLTTGEIAMVMVDEEDTAVEQVRLPTKLTLNLRPFYGSAEVILEVELRYRWSKQNGVRFGLVRVRPDRSEDAAWLDVCAQVQAGLPDHPLLQGAPPASLRNDRGGLTAR